MWRWHILDCLPIGVKGKIIPRGNINKVMKTSAIWEEFYGAKLELYVIIKRLHKIRATLHASNNSHMQYPFTVQLNA